MFMGSGDSLVDGTRSIIAKIMSTNFDAICLKAQRAQGTHPSGRMPPRARAKLQPPRKAPRRARRLVHDCIECNQPIEEVVGDDNYNCYVCNYCHAAWAEQYHPYGVEWAPDVGQPPIYLHRNCRWSHYRACHERETPSAFSLPTEHGSEDSEEIEGDLEGDRGGDRRDSPLIGNRRHERTESDRELERELFGDSGTESVRELFVDDDRGSPGGELPAPHPSSSSGCTIAEAAESQAPDSHARNERSQPCDHPSEEEQPTDLDTEVEWGSSDHDPEGGHRGE